MVLGEGGGGKRQAMRVGKMWDMRVVLGEKVHGEELARASRCWEGE